MNKVISPKRLAIGSTVYRGTFFMKSIVMSLFMSQKTAIMTFFTYHYTRNFFLTREYVSTSCTQVSTQVRCGKAICKHF